MLLKKNFRNRSSKETVNIKGLYVFIVVSLSILLLYGCLYFFGFSDVAGFEATVICGLAFYVATPILAVLFGYYSVVFTKRIIVPNLCLFLIYNIFFGVFINGFIVGNEKYSISHFLDALPLSCVFGGISLVASLVALWDYKSYLKAKNAGAENSTDNGDLK